MGQRNSLSKDIPAQTRWTYSPDPEVEAALVAIEKRHPPLYTGGIERTLAFLEKLGNPHLHLPPVFHVAGTNGKGSTLAFLQAIFEAGGLSVHKYTSPHLVRFEERVVLNGRMIESKVFLALVDECAAEAAGMEVSFFEFFTVLAFLAFARHPADAVLLETGLGGTLDATNVVPSTQGIITRISYDHMNVLGATLEEIAANKAGIMRKDGHCVVGWQADTGVSQTLERCAEKMNVAPFRAGKEWGVDKSESGFLYKSAGFSFSLPLPSLQGAHQIDNAGNAIAALERSAFSELLTQDTLSRAVTKTAWPGRMQRLKTGPATALLPKGWELWLDGAHNDSGAETLVRQMTAWQVDGKPLHLVMAMKNDKDAVAFCRPLAPFIASSVALEEDVGAPMMRAEELCRHMRHAGFPHVSLAENLTVAVQSLAVFPSLPPRRILITGSLYLAGHVLRTHCS